ncbi:interleukin-2 receptor subunit beta [Discoglossus pictus]
MAIYESKKQCLAMFRALMCSRVRAEYILVLSTRMSEFTSQWVVDARSLQTIPAVMKLKKFRSEEESYDPQSFSAMLASWLFLCSLLHLLFLNLAVTGSPSLDCTYNSWDILSCSWDDRNHSMTSPCYVQANATKRKNRMGFCTLPPGAPPQQCNLQLNNPAKRLPALTWADIVEIKVTCEEDSNMTVRSSLKLSPYNNLRLDPPQILDIQETTNGLWNISWECRTSHYLEDNMEFTVNYKPSKDPWQAAKNLSEKQNEMWVPLRNLLPDTLYEARVQVIVKEKGSRWSDWSQVKTYGTLPKVDLVQDYQLLSIISVAVGTVLILGIYLFCFSDRFKRMIWVGVPNPSSFFETLIITHKGNFQNWLSSPFSLSSFSLDSTPQEISPVDISLNKEESLSIYANLPSRENPIDNSGHSLSSFSNQEYFFFQFPTIKEEVGSTTIYFAYDDLEQRGFPAIQQTMPIPSQLPGDELTLFHADYLSIPPSVGINNGSFVRDPKSIITLAPSSVQEDLKEQDQEELHSHDPLLPSEMEVFEEKKAEEYDSLKEEPGGGAILPVEQQQGPVPYPEGDAARGYLSLKELYRQHTSLWV